MYNKRKRKTNRDEQLTRKMCVRREKGKQQHEVWRPGELEGVWQQQQSEIAD